MPYNVCGMMYITRSFTKSLSLKVGSATATKDWLSYRFLSLRSIRKIRNSQLFLDNGLACTSRAGRRKKKEASTVARSICGSGRHERRREGGREGGKRKSLAVIDRTLSSGTATRHYFIINGKSALHLPPRRYYNTCAIKLFDGSRTLQN